MKWYKNLYFSEDARKKAVKIVKKLQNREFQPGVYVITLSLEKSDLFDIYPSYVLLQDYFQDKELVIIGLACSMEEALQLVTDIVEEVYSSTKGVELRTYFQEQE